MNKPRELDNLVENYFGQDYDVIDDSDEIGPKIEACNTHSSKSMQIALLEDIEEFLAQGEQLNVIFKDRYSSYFLPELWGTTPRDFLLLAKDKVVADIVRRER
ncbi:contact-dependent growth inhibition system immunity protein [Lelliottia amnigena]|uniref:Contact-dependent growth inhibition system immunity protein n=1 Tax=Lelliottia amnigena TaxID=61646 RepID=A0ABU7UIM4_LELAM